MKLFCAIFYVPDLFIILYYRLESERLRAAVTHPYQLPRTPLCQFHLIICSLLDF